MKIKSFVFYVLVISIFFSCDTTGKFETHDSGLKYKYFIHNEDAAKPETGDILELKIRYKTEDDSIIEESEFYRMQLTEPTHSGGSIEDGLSLLHKDDSISFIVDAYNFYSKTRHVDLPAFLKPGDKLYINIKLISFMGYNDFEQERRSIRSSDADEEDNLLKSYVKRTNITSEPTTSGLYYVEKRAGTGQEAKPGKKVRVHYYGYFVDGKPFDNSYERGDPFEFTLGVGQVIPGWDEGIAKMKVGGKAILVIPSYLAYGDKQRGSIPPFSTLVFEVELMGVEK